MAESIMAGLAVREPQITSPLMPACSRQFVPRNGALRPSAHVVEEIDPVRRAVRLITDVFIHPHQVVEGWRVKLEFILKYNYGGAWRDAQWPNPDKMLVQYKMAAGKSNLDSSYSSKKADEKIWNLFRQTTGSTLDAIQTEMLARRYSNFAINWDTDEPQNMLLPYLGIFKSLGQRKRRWTKRPKCAMSWPDELSFTNDSGVII